jgi:hypothetical protein
VKSNDFSPIAEQGELEHEAGIFSKLKRRREIAPVAPGFVRILLDANGAPIKELTAGQKYWSRAHGWVKVDVRSHTLEYEISFPDPSGLAGFVAVVDVAVAVTDPVGSVKKGAESVEEIVRPALQNAIRKAHGGSPAPAGNENPVGVLNDLRVTADRNLEALVGPVPEMPGWLSAKVTSVTVGLDGATEDHRKELMSKIRAVALADADGKSEIAKAKNEMMVRQVWEEGFANHLADPERRALARIAADPSRENIDRVAGQFDQIEAQGRAAIVETLREAINKGYFAEDDAIHNAISALEKQYGNPQYALGASAPSKEVGAAPETDEHVIDAETVETETTGEDEAETKAGSGDNGNDEEGGSDSDWSR